MSGAHRTTVSTADEHGRRFCTFDTGGMDDIFAGALVTWLHVPRGGYGYVLPVDAKVVGGGASGIRIEVTTRSGRLVQRRVALENLRWRR